MISSSQNEIGRIVDAYEGGNEDLQQQIEGAQQQNIQLQNQIAGAQQQNIQLQNQIAGVQQQAQQQIEGAQQQNTQLQQQIEGAQQQIIGIQQQAENRVEQLIQQGNAAIEAQQIELGQVVDAYEEEKKDLQEDLGEARELIQIAEELPVYVKGARFPELCRRFRDRVTASIFQFPSKDRDTVTRLLKQIGGFCNDSLLTTPRSLRMLRESIRIIISLIPPNQPELMDIVTTFERQVGIMAQVPTEEGRKRKRIQGGGELTLSDLGVNAQSHKDGTLFKGDDVGLFIRPLERGVYSFRDKMNGDVYELVWAKNPKSMKLLEKLGATVVSLGVNIPDLEKFMSPIRVRKLVKVNGDETSIKTQMWLLKR